MTSLLPCPACHRHVRPTEHVCPFCAARLNVGELTLAAKRRSSPAPSELKRALLYAIGTGSLVLVACEDQVSSPSPNTSSLHTNSVDRDELPPTEPMIEYELQWRTLTDEERCALVHPEPCPTPEQKSSAPKRIKVPKRVCNADPSPDPLYGGCF